MRSRRAKQAPSSAPRAYPCISTERIMRAVEQQRRITDQLDGLRAQQRVRSGRVIPKIVGSMFALVVVGIIGLLALFLFQPDLFLAFLSFSSGIIDIILQLARYLSSWLVFIASQGWLQAGAGLVIVIMMGIWLGLMRPPREA